MPPYNPDDYEPVEVRIEKFWVKYPSGRIETELCSPPANFEQCRYVARVFAERTDEKAIASGYAFEIAGSGPVNRTNHEENCETSAIGRALANAGFAPKGKRPSRQEMQKANRGAAARTETPRTPQPSSAPHTEPESSAGGEMTTQRQVRYLQAVAREAGLSDDLLKRRSADEFGQPDYNALKKRDCSTLIDLIQHDAGAASRPQQPSDGATPAQLRNIERLVTKLGKDRQKIKDYYHVAHLADLSKAQASQVIERYMVEAGETQQAMPIGAALSASGEPGNDARTR